MKTKYPIVELLEQYEAAAVTVSHLQQTEQAILKQGRPTLPRLDAALAARADLPAPPGREDAIKMCVNHLEGLAAEFAELGEQIAPGIRAEMEAKVSLAAAEIRQVYAKANPRLNLPTKNEPVDTARAAFGEAQYLVQVIATKRRAILETIDRSYPGASLDNQACWQAAATRRVDRVFGEIYEEQNLNSITSKLGLSRDALARLVKVG